jgi:protein-L-isoaspartate(D-aspartate) O-methyltransferase
VEMGGDTHESRRRRTELVDSLIAAGPIRSGQVEQAFRAVPRHIFLPGVPLRVVYDDLAVQVKFLDGRPSSSSSQPSIMATMLEQLSLQSGQHVLEIGAGTGYNAALIAHMVGPAGRVYAVDIDEEIVTLARRNLTSARCRNVTVLHGDGALGYSARAPYERIVLTVGATDIAPAWRRDLRQGGRLLLPLSIRANMHKAIAFDYENDSLISASIVDCGFMPLRGPFAGPERAVTVGPSPGVDVSCSTSCGSTPREAYEFLTSPGTELRTGLFVSPDAVGGGLGFWLCVAESEVCTISAPPRFIHRGSVPCVFGFAGSSPAGLTIGILSRRGLAVLSRPKPLPTSFARYLSPEPFQLCVRMYGPSGPAIGRRLLAQLNDWAAAGRPSTTDFRIIAFPSANTDWQSGDMVVRKPHSTLVVRRTG